MSRRLPSRLAPAPVLHVAGYTLTSDGTTTRVEDHATGRTWTLPSGQTPEDFIEAVRRRSGA